MRDLTLSDETLGAYVDGELDAASAADVETRLRHNPAARERVAAIRRVSGLVRDVVHAPVEGEAPAALPGAARSPSPPRVVAMKLKPRRPRRKTSPWRVAAGFAAGACCTALALWLLGGPAAPASSWEDHALLFHQTYLEALEADRHLPLDALGSDPAALDASLARLVDWQFAVPDLSAEGYTLEGARVIATAEGPLAYVLYSNAHAPLLGLAMLHSAVPSVESGELHERGKLRLWEWSDGEHQFALGGTHSVKSLQALATAIEQAASKHRGPPSDI